MLDVQTKVHMSSSFDRRNWWVGWNKKPHYRFGRLIPLFSELTPNRQPE